MTLSDYELEIKNCERLEPGPVPTDHYGQPIYVSKTQYSICRLAELSQEIRSIAWSGPFHAAAWALARRADDSGSRIAGEHGFGFSPLPRHGSVGHTADGHVYGGIY